MKNEKLGVLSNAKIQFMIKKGLIDEPPFLLKEVGNYLTTMYLDKYIPTYDDSYEIKLKKNKNFIEALQRMRSKFQYAYYVDIEVGEYSNKENIKIYPLMHIHYDNKYNSKPRFVKDTNGRYPRLIFSNEYIYAKNEPIDLNPDYYEPEILEICLNDMRISGASGLNIDTILELKDVYIQVKNSLDIPQRELNQLEMRYILYGQSFSPYKTNYEAERFVIYKTTDDVEFDEILKYFDINKKQFYDLSQKPRKTDGLFTKELNHLKKYLTLMYIHEIGLYPRYLDKDKMDTTEYWTEINQIVTDKYFIENMRVLYKLLVLPYKIYEIQDPYSKEYKKKFNWYIEVKGYSKWQTQEMMRRYRWLTDQMQLDAPEELLDLVDAFLGSYDYVANYL